MKTWIVVANRREAKFYTYLNHRSSDVRFLSKLENPRGRLKNRDIDADKPGVFSSVLSYGTKLVKQQSPTERVAVEFAKEVAVFIDEGRKSKLFDNFILVADPTFLGHIRKALAKPSVDVLARTVAKDFGPEMTEEEIKDRLFPEGDDLGIEGFV